VNPEARGNSARTIKKIEFRPFLWGSSKTRGASRALDVGRVDAIEAESAAIRLNLTIEIRKMKALTKVLSKPTA
jgi:hypothetical protein